MTDTGLGEALELKRAGRLDEAVIAGPLAQAARLAPSGDWMRSPFSNAVRATVTSMLRYLGHLSDEWDRLAGALNLAASEAEAAARMQAVGLTPTCTDPAECLRPLPFLGTRPVAARPGMGAVTRSGIGVCVPLPGASEEARRSPAGRLGGTRNRAASVRPGLLDRFFSQYGGEKNGLGYGEALKVFMESKKW